MLAAERTYSACGSAAPAELDLLLSIASAGTVFRHVQKRRANKAEIPYPFLTVNLSPPEHPRHDARSRKPEKLWDCRDVRYCVEAPQHCQGGVSALTPERVLRQGTKPFFDLGVASAWRESPGLAGDR